MGDRNREMRLAGQVEALEVICMTLVSLADEGTRVDFYEDIQTARDSADRRPEGVLFKSREALDSFLTTLDRVRLAAS